MIQMLKMRSFPKRLTKTFLNKVNPKRLAKREELLLVRTPRISVNM